MSAVIDALEAAVTALEKEHEALEQNLRVASNERSGREEEIGKRINENRREIQQVRGLISTILEGM